MKVEAVLYDRLGATRLAPLPQAAEIVPVTRNLLGPDELTFKVPALDPVAGLIYEGVTEVAVLLDGNPDPYFYGTVWDMTSKGKDSYLTYTCESLESLFFDRRIEDDLYFENMDQAEIVWQLIQHTQLQPGGDFNINSGHTPTGRIRDRPYHRDERQIIQERMHSFRTIIDGMDWDIVVLADGRREYRNWYPKRGSRKMAHVLEWGKNITDYDLKVDGRMTNDAIQMGEGEGPDRLEGRYTDPVARDARGLRTHVLALDESLTQEATMIAKARAYVEANVVPNRFVDVSINFSDPNALDVGDEVPVRINRGAVHITGIYRIQSISINPNQNTAWLDLEWADSWEDAA